MFSVINTLKQAIDVGLRHFGLLVGLSALAAIPSEVIVLAAGNSKGSISFTQGFIAFLGTLVVIAADSIKTAAVLGVLKKSPSGADIPTVVVKSIKTYTWTLIRLSILLMLITMAVTIPVSLAAVVLVSLRMQAPQLLVILLSVIYLVFIKYALATPLVVVENMRARGALRKSWEMTKGCFWYVLGCYVFLGLGEFSISTIFTYFVPETPKLFDIPVCTLNDLGESLWILTAWCMYLRIREVDGLTPPQLTKSPQESPSSSQSA